MNGEPAVPVKRDYFQAYFWAKLASIGGEATSVGICKKLEKNYHRLKFPKSNNDSNLGNPSNPIQPMIKSLNPNLLSLSVFLVNLHRMGVLRYYINLTLDGCVDHRAVFTPFDELHRVATEKITQADALLYGRVTYQMMEEAFKNSADDEPFVQAINDAKKYVVSSTLKRVDWNAELVSGNLMDAIQQLKSTQDILVGGVKLPLALAELGLIDEYEFLIQPGIAGHGPTLFAGLSKQIQLQLVSRQELDSGAVVMRYQSKS